jgi:hypothetical protein
MASSKATTVAAYLKELPPDRRAVVSKVRDVVRNNLPKGYEEGMMWGMIGYVVPKKVLPDTYNDQPLCYVALASQKNYISLYLMSVYGSSEHAAKFKADFEATGRKLDMGKSCVHFRKLDDLPLDLIARTVAAVPMARWVEIYKASRGTKAQR